MKRLLKKQNQKKPQKVNKARELGKQKCEIGFSYWMDKKIKNIITSILLSLQMWFWLVNLNNNSTPQGLCPKEEINYFRVIIVSQRA